MSLNSVVGLSCGQGCVHLGGWFWGLTQSRACGGWRGCGTRQRAWGRAGLRTRLELGDRLHPADPRVGHDVDGVVEDEPVGREAERLVELLR
eukprot:6222670-Prymnesium_polylepis.1